MPNNQLPLTGIRVIEFATAVAGPMVGKILADYGAQVVCVENEESIRKGVAGRHPGPGASSLTSLNLGHTFNKFNTNKLSVTLNLNHREGRELARRLVSLSQVVITNLVPTALKRFGLTYEELVKVKPDIIMLAMPAFGMDGPYRDFRTLSWNMLAMCGFDHMTTSTGRSPIRASPYSHPDSSSQPFHGMVALLSALYWRARTGRGQFIELSQYESTLNFTGTFIFDYLVNKRRRQPQGNRSDDAAPHGVYRCQGQDQWCAIAVFTPEEWRAFCRVIGRADLAGDRRFATLADRKTNAEALDQIISEWTVQRSPWEVMELLQGAGVAAGVVESVEDLLRRDPQLRERGHWVKVVHPEAGEMTLEDWAFKMSNVPALQWRHAPLLGEHNDYVFKEILHMPEEEIDRLIVDGVIG
ncbi:MAG: CoA transferase [Chloroflexi bacterium]|nr:CoA transferase [Chloroflexota bacterium]